MVKALPGTNLKGIPHINSKIHVWKKDYGSLVSMLSHIGICWNDTTKMIEVHDNVWADYVKVDANARLMRFKSWPFYNVWVNIFGKNRAMGEYAEGFTKAVNHVLNGTTTQDEEPPNQFRNLFEESHDEIENMSKLLKILDPQRRRMLVKEYQQTARTLCIFCQNTDARLGDIAKRIGFEYDILMDRKEVFGMVCKIEGLSLQEKLLVLKLFVKNTEDLELFFSLPTEAKAEFARIKLAGNL
ncbi:hypothetical protein DH2020_008013 [Rehmannia glutinosa]|uniref:Myb/SANT-like domain-containing protein n=1 Tax=Rehmannia glutinosa TaxID=99300 RepID=A0ABR0TZS3_REHGL